MMKIMKYNNHSEIRTKVLKYLQELVGILNS